MQQFADMACNAACIIMHNMSRTASFMLEIQIDLSHLRLRMVEVALEGMRELGYKLGDMHDWTSLASVQNILMKMQPSHSAAALKTWVEFTDKLQITYLRRLTEWTW